MTICFGLFTLISHHQVKEGNLKRSFQSYRVLIVIGRGECRKEISFFLRDNVRIHYNCWVVGEKCNNT